MVALHGFLPKNTDRRTGSFDHSAGVLDALDRREVPLVLCSGQTRAEVEQVRELFGIRHPFIARPNATVFVPAGYFSEAPHQAAAHLDSAHAVEWLCARYRKALGPIVTVGLGVTPDHLPLLQRVDIPLIVRSEEAGMTARLVAELPRARLTDIDGPSGWPAILLGLLQLARNRLQSFADRRWWANKFTNRQSGGNGHRSIHSTNDPTLSVTIITRRTRSLVYINFAPARPASTDG